MPMTEDEKKIVDKITLLKHSDSVARKSWEENCRMWYEQFNGTIPTGESYPWRSKIFMKETFKCIDTIHPLFMDMIFMQGNSFRVKGQESPVSEKQQKIIEHLITFYIEKMDLYNSLDDFIKEMLIIGVAFGKMCWKKEVKTWSSIEEVETKLKPFIKDGIPIERIKKETKKVKKEKTTYDYPYFEHISYKDIFISTRATSIKDTWVIHRTWKTLDQLKQIDNSVFTSTGEHKYKNLSALEYLITTAQESDQQELITAQEKGNIGISDSNQSAKEVDDTVIGNRLEQNQSGELEILEFWDTLGERVQVVAGGQILILDKENPFDHRQKPFIVCNYVRRPKEILGIGICELTADGQRFLNTSVNQAIDSNTLANNLMLLVDADCGIDDNNAIAKPGGIIPITLQPGEKVSDKVTPIKFPKIDTSSEVGLAMNEMREVTGASKLMQGTYESGAVRSNSQQNTLMAASQKKFMGKVLTFESMFLKPFIRMLYNLIQQYVTQDIIISLVGEEGQQYIRVKPEDIALDLDFIPVGSKQLIEMSQLVHQMEQLLQIASRLPMSQSIVNFKYIIKKIWQNLSSDHDTDQVIFDDATSQKIMQQMMQQQQMEQGGPSAGNPSQLPNSPSQPNMMGGVQ